MKILLASSGIPGHLNPILSVANLLKKHNHEVLVVTSPELRAAVLTAGLPFHSEIPESKTFFGHLLELPGRQDVPPGMETATFDIVQYFIPNMPAQTKSLQLILENFHADIIVADNFYWGIFPFLLGPRNQRPAVAHLGISVLNTCSGRSVPKRKDASEAVMEAERVRRERILLQPSQIAVDKELSQMGYRPLPCPLFEAMATLPDLYLHPGIESFEYPDTTSSFPNVRYVGPLPLPAGETSLPPWWKELDKKKRLVLVTQGTLANRDFGQLIGPALEGLAKEEDVLVLVTTGGQPIDLIPVEIPSNARVAPFLPFGQIMPHIDLLITNGGYGTVNMALAQGIPMVTAGLTEDKEDVSAHVAWAGVGIDLHTNQADSEILRKAAREVLDTPSYRQRAKELALEFASHDTEKEILVLLEECVQEQKDFVSSQESSELKTA